MVNGPTTVQASVNTPKTNGQPGNKPGPSFGNSGNTGGTTGGKTATPPGSGQAKSYRARFKNFFSRNFNRAKSTAQNTAKKNNYFKPFLGRLGRLAKNKYTCGTLGVLAGLTAGYSILKDGYVKGMRDTKKQMADYYTNVFIKSNKSSKYNHLFENIGGKALDWKLDDPIYPLFTKTKNVASAMAGEVFNNSITIGLAAGAMAPLLIGGTVGTVIGVTSAALIGLGAAKMLFFDILGNGRKGL